MRKSEILQQQKVALFEAYKKVLKETKGKATLYPKAWLIHKILNSQAPQTYISYKVAQVVISKFIDGSYKKSKWQTIEDRNQNLYEKYKTLLAQAQEKNEYIVKTMLVEKAIYQPTPRFYITPQKASTFINEMLRR